MSSNTRTRREHDLDEARPFAGVCSSKALATSMVDEEDAERKRRRTATRSVKPRNTRAATSESEHETHNQPETTASEKAGAAEQLAIRSDTQEIGGRALPPRGRRRW